MDALPPAPPAVYAKFQAPAAGDIYGRTDRERDLCKKASRTDWAYIAAGPLLVAGSVVADSFLHSSADGLVTTNDSLDKKTPRLLLGAGTVGLAWGFMVGSVYPSLSKCSRTWVDSAPAEGREGTSWPLVVAISTIAGFTAPIFMGVEQGFDGPYRWSLSQRRERLFVSAATGILGSLIPYSALSPRTWAAAKELEKLRVDAYGDGVAATYRFSF